MKNLMPRNDRLRQHRIQRNWRQQDIADQLETTITTIHRWERGCQQPGAYYRAKLCELFGLSAQELGLVGATPSLSEDEIAEAEPASASPARGIARWNIPYARNPHFTGREDLLFQLEQRLDPSIANQAGTIRQPQAITGLGGIGKTQIAVEYAYRARAQERYTHTLWITASCEDSILTSFSKLSYLLPAATTKDEIGHPQLVTAIIVWLEQEEQPWLLIFDNVDDPSFIQPYLPRRGNGSVLLTTRASAVGSFAACIEVETLGVVEGAQILLRRAQRETCASEEEINEAINIVIALEQFPLALDQAGAYIEETRCSLGDYLQLYEQHRHALLARRGRQSTGYPESVTTTWSLAFERVKRSNPAAAELLCLCTCFAPEHIPEEILTEGAAHWPPLLQQAVANLFAFNHLLETLLSFSLIKRLSEDHLLSIHRLVQIVQMETMKPEERREWAQRVICAIHSVFPRNPESNITSWLRCQRYLEQVQMCVLLIQQHQFLFPEAADLLDRAGAFLRDHASHTLAEPLLQHSSKS
ncbi:MAG TPA: NB-ARC domain-containing protein [Ktedonobacteraceae bacterium]|nr:NB-ARC domain-containing protein [Ktedonobacteraceae bacterium]